MSINKVILVGRLGNDPELKQMPNGNSVANLSLATSESWMDKTTNEKKEKTEWHRVVIFGKTAEIAGQYLKKGSQVYIEGQLQTRKWQDKDGQEKYTTEIVVQGYSGIMQMLGSGGNQQQEQPQQQPQQQAQQPRQQQKQQPQQNQYPQSYTQPQQQQQQRPQYNQPSQNFDDEIPF